MSHIFISYSHENEKHLQTFCDALRQHGFDQDEIWIDKSGIRGGEDWEREIDTALEEAYAVVIILTPQSLESRYVLYEWVWALGIGKRCVPIEFEDIHKKSIEHLKHPLYGRKQFKKWDDHEKEIVDELIELKKGTPLNYSVPVGLSKIVLPTYIMLRTCLLCLSYFYRGRLIDTYELSYLLVFVRQELPKRLDALSDYWTKRTSAFTRFEKKQLDQLVGELDELSLRLAEVDRYCTDFSSSMDSDQEGDMAQTQNLNISRLLELTDSVYNLAFEKLRLTKELAKQFNDYCNALSADNNPINNSELKLLYHVLLNNTGFFNQVTIQIGNDTGLEKIKPFIDKIYSYRERELRKSLTRSDQ